MRCHRGPRSALAEPVTESTGARLAVARAAVFVRDMPRRDRGMIGVAYSEALGHVRGQATVVGRVRTVIRTPTVMTASAVATGAQNIGIRARHPRRLSHGRCRQAYETTRGAKFVENGVQPVECKPILRRLERYPGEDTDGSDVEMRRLHEAHVVVPGGGRPLFRVVVAAVPDLRQARIDR